MDLSHIAVVILNFNGKGFLEKFLPSVLAHSGNAQTIVADNGSTDGSLEFMRERFQQVRLIAFEKNWGFCDGYNKALAQVDAPFYVLLNSDIEVRPNWLAPMNALMQANPRIWACQPKVLAHHRPTHFEHAGAAGGLIDMLGYPFCRGRMFDEVEEDKGQYAQDTPIFWATGACLCIRQEAYHRLGGLDPRFFAHMEEIDLCWKIHQSGGEVWYCGRSEILHVGGGTLNYMSPRKTFFNFRNGLALLFKNLPLGWAFPIIFIRLCLDGIAGLRFLAKGMPEHCWAVVHAHMAFYAMTPYLWGKRIAFPESGRRLAFNKLEKKSIVWEHFFGAPQTISDKN